MHTKDSDAVARYLLTETTARDLEITSHGLEDAFLSLTGDAPMTLHPHPTIDPTTRRVPPLGGFNLTMLRIELAGCCATAARSSSPWSSRRRCSSRSPAPTGWDDPVGSGNVAAYIMVSMALYGAALTAASGGAMVAMERALGWSRQLRLTPLNPVAYIVIKALVALAMGALAVAVVNVGGVVQGKPEMPRRRLGRAAALVTLVCTLIFAALGVFVGYLVPGENAMQILGPGLALLSFLGDVFIPLTEGSADLAHRALDPDVRRRRDRPRAAHARAARGTPSSTPSLWLAIFVRWRGVADEQGHGPGVTSLTVVGQDQCATPPTGPPVRTGARSALRRHLALLPAQPARSRAGATATRWPGSSASSATVAFAAVYMSLWVQGPRRPPAAVDSRRALRWSSYVGALVALGRCDGGLLGEPGLACTVYVSVACVMVFPFRVAAPIVAVRRGRRHRPSAVEDWGSQVGTAFGDHGRLGRGLRPARR